MVCVKRFSKTHLLCMHFMAKLLIMKQLHKLVFQNIFAPLNNLNSTIDEKNDFIQYVRTWNGLSIWAKY